MATFVELPFDMVNEIIKYTSWSNRIVNKDFNRFIDEDESRFIKMKIDNNTKTPFFDQQFLADDIPFAEKIKSLEIVECDELIDIGPLAKCKALMELDLTDSYNLHDIRPLAHCLNLAKLNLNGIFGVEISPLANCISLTELNLNECLWTDNAVRGALDSLAKCTALKKLDISCMDSVVHDIGPLVHCNALVDLTACAFADIGVISKLTSLEHLSFSDASLNDIRPLSKLMALKTLEMYDSEQLEDITPLMKCKSLKKLVVSNCAKHIDVTLLKKSMTDLVVIVL